MDSLLAIVSKHNREEFFIASLEKRYAYDVIYFHKEKADCVRLRRASLPHWDGIYATHVEGDLFTLQPCDSWEDLTVKEDGVISAVLAYFTHRSFKQG